MNRYTITLSTEWRKLYQTTIVAKTEQEAIKLAVKDAESKGKYIPDEPWVHIKLHKSKS